MTTKVNLGQKFEEVLARMEEVETRKEDILKLPKDIRATDRGGIQISGLGNVGFTKTGFQALCTKLDLPSTYMQRLIDNEGKSTYEIERDLKLFGENVNRGVETLKEDNQIFIRTLKDDNGVSNVRAVFSDRYNVVDNLPILQQMKGFDHDLLETQSFNVTSDFLDIRFTMPHLQRSMGYLPEREVKFGLKEDIIMPAIHFRNSETGQSKVQVSFVVYRLVCTNGLVNMKDQYKIVNKKHMGEYDVEDINNRIAHVTHRAAEMFEQYADHLINSKSIKVESPEEIFETIGKRAGITGRMMKSVNMNWITEQAAERTKHGVISAITAGARDWHNETKDFTGRIRLEEVAGDLLFAKAM